MKLLTALCEALGFEVKRSVEVSDVGRCIAPDEYINLSRQVCGDFRQKEFRFIKGEGYQEVQRVSKYNLTGPTTKPKQT